MNHKKILVIDDDPDIRAFNMAVVEENGYIPLSASNGEEGFAIIQKEKPDLVILDVLMPLQSGIRLYYKLKTDDALKDIPVIILSGISKKCFLASEDVLSEFSGKKIPEPAIYLEKPVEPKTLANAIKNILT